MPKVDIEVATVRATSWIARNMRDIDKDEIHCQLKDPTAALIAHQQIALSPRCKYVACVDGEPICAYGMAEWQPGLGHLWAFGTKKIYGVLRDVTNHINDAIYKEIFADSNVHRVECRSIATHTQAHGWLEKIRLHHVADLPCYGKNAEDFKLFALTRKEIGYVQHTDTSTGPRTSNRKRRRAKGKKRPG